MLRNLLRRQPLVIVLALLLALNAARYWQRRSAAAAALSEEVRFPPPPGSPEGVPGGDPFSNPDPARRQRMEAMLQTMPKEQRAAVEARMSSDRAFFQSIRDLPEEQRREKLREHFAQNPPPPGMFGPGDPGAGGPGGPDGSGGPGPDGDPMNGGPMHVPPPDIRRSLDQQIADSQGGTGS